MEQKPKKLMGICSSQVGCDGNNVPEMGMMCARCRETLYKRAVAAAFAKSIERQLMGLE